MLLHPTSVSSDQFTFSKKSNSFITCISDLGKHFRLGRVYDDACDAGFSIVSSVTGKHVVFAEEGKTTDAEGDLVSLNFVCVTPNFKHLKAVLFND